MSKKSVLIICPFFPPNVGGVETHLNGLVDYLSTKGHKVIVQTYKPLLTHVKNYKKKETRKNVTIYRHWLFGVNFYEKISFFQPLQTLYTVPLLLIHSLLFMSRNKNKVDVINSHGLNATIIGLILKKLFKKRLVATTHYIYTVKSESVKAGLVKKVFNSSDVILTAGKESKDDLLKAGIPSKKLVPYIHWTNDFKPLNKNKMKKSLGLSRKFVVLFVGRIIKMKGVMQLCEAMKGLSNDEHVLIAGDGNDFDELKTKYSKLENVSILGKKNKKELKKLYCACDCVILPSQSEEASPLVILESLSNGRPIILTNKGGAKNLVDDSVSLVINPKVNNIKEAIKKMKRKINNKTEQTCLKYAKKKYGEENAKNYTSYIIGVK